jgi:AcrR family transcriptional regulator
MNALTAPAADERRTDTRMRLIEAAARHFADHGLRGASQRAIQREVGVNPASAHYYFGSKDALYKAVIETFLEQIQAERVTGLEAIPEGLAPRERLYQLLYAYLGPHLRLSATKHGYNYARILARVQYEGHHAGTALFEEAVAKVRILYIDELAKVFPRASRTSLQYGLTMAVAMMAMASIQGEGQEVQRSPKLTEQMARYAAAGFESLCGPLDA